MISSITVRVITPSGVSEKVSISPELAVEPDKEYPK
jgi:hypothetical protein